MIAKLQTIAALLALAGTTLGAVVVAAPVAVHVQSIETFMSTTDELDWPGQTANFVFHAGVTNITLYPNVETGSNVIGALQTAGNAWEAVSGFTYTDNNTSTTSTQNGVMDGANIVTFANTATNQSLSSGAIAVARFNFNLSSGDLVLTEADLIFNPTLTFSTQGTAGFHDIQAIATHEFGHAFGLAHSPITSATMFASTTTGSQVARTLSTDDIAAINHTYPTFEHFFTHGAIEGTITKGGSAVYGAHVAARSTIDGTTYTGTISNPNGTYQIVGLPPGPYQVYAEPLDGPGSDADITSSFFTTGKDTNFQTTFLGGNSAPTTVRVRPAMLTSNVDIAVTNLSPTLNLTFIGESPTGMGSFTVAPSGLEIAPGVSTNVVVAGALVSTTPDTAFSMAGHGITFGPSSIASGTFGAPSTDSFKIFPLVISADAVPGPRDITMTVGSEISIFSGGVDIGIASSPVAVDIAYGFGCAGSGATMTLSSLNGPPTISNQSYGLSVTGTAPGETVYLVPSFYPDFINLGNGCAVWINISHFIFAPPDSIDFMSDPALTHTDIATPIPNDMTLAGVEIYLQAAASDAAAANGFAISNGLKIIFR